VVTLGNRVAGSLYPIGRASGPVSVDGALGEYAASPYVDLSDALAAAGSDDRVTARLAWDATALYAAFDVIDPTLVVNSGGSDGEVWDGDGVEVMIHLGARRRPFRPPTSMCWRTPTATSPTSAVRPRMEPVMEPDRAPRLGRTKGIRVRGRDGDSLGGPRHRRAAGRHAHRARPRPQRRRHSGAAPKQVDWAGLTAFAQPGRWLGGRLEAAPACSAPGGAP